MPHRFFAKLPLERILVLASVVLGAVHAWVGRYSMNPDGVSYLDMGDALVRRDWVNALNAYWSPLYGWILGIVVNAVKPPRKWEFPLVHLVNFVIFLLVTGVIVLTLLSGRVWLAGLREFWPLIAIPVAAMALYAPVHVEDRFLGGFVLVLFLTLLAAVRLRPADHRSASYVALAVFITVALGIADLTIRYATDHLAIPSVGPNSTLEHLVAAEQLRRMGARPGDRVAIIGDGTGAYWARLAKLRIIAEIMAANHGAEEFWRASELAQQQVYDAFANAGATLVIASCPPGTSAGWQQIEGTTYCVYPLHRPQ